MEVARLCKLRFPLGGHRFRPALEDVLQMVQAEFGLDVGPAWADRLKESRLEYRRQQAAAAVRDAPLEAARVLREMGFGVTQPEGVTDRESRLLAY